jgi:hypothetical protein
MRGWNEDWECEQAAARKKTIRVSFTTDTPLTKVMIAGSLSDHIAAQKAEWLVGEGGVRDIFTSFVQQFHIKSRPVDGILTVIAGFTVGRALVHLIVIAAPEQCQARQGFPIVDSSPHRVVDS